MPTTISALVEHERWDEVKDYSIMDCMECGSCSYICPAKRKLVDYIKFGKAQLAAIRTQQNEEKA